MAKKLRDEDLVLNIIINGNKSKKEMNELERAITDTNREINQLKKTQTALAAQDKKDTDAYRTATKAIKEKEAAITFAESRLSQLRSGMKLTEMSLADLAKEQTKLNKLWRTATPGSENAAKFKEQLDAVKARLGELDGKAKKTGISLRGMADNFNHYIGVITAGILTFMGVITGLKQINETFAEFDDKVADVQKTTGMAKHEVRDLNEELKKIDTRTQQEDLLGLARVAGKLGITGKDDVLGFVRATDQIGVALTEDLGGDIEESINQIGKLVEIFNLKEEFGIEKSLLKVGSSINDLGANSSANEGFLVGFTKQVAGVAPAAGFSIQNILGLAATLDQLGQTVEVSGTTFNDVIPSMFKDTATFAHAAGMELGDFTSLLKTDANEALIKVLDGIKGNNAGFAEMVVKLNALGVDGTRAMNVMNALAGKTGVLREQQLIANQAFEKGTSLTNEYNIKNQTAAANMDRAKKAIYNMTVELGEKLNPVMTGTTSLFVMMIKVLSEVVSFVIEYRKVILTAVSAIAAYNAVLLISNILTKEGIVFKKLDAAGTALQTFAIKSLQGAVILLAAAKALLTGNITRASIAMKMFNAVVGLNPFAIILSLLAAVTTALVLYGNQLTSAQKAQKNLIDAETEAQQSLVSQRIELERLVTTARDKTKTDQERAAAIKQLNELSPEHLGFLNLENIATEKATSATNNYIDALLKQARVAAASAKMVELEKRKIELALKPQETETDFWQKTKAFMMSGTQEAYFKNVGKYAVQNAKKEAAEIKATQEALNTYLNSNQPKISKAPSQPGSSIGSDLTQDQVKAREKYALEAKSQIDQEKAAHKARLVEAGLFGKARANMTKEDLQSLADLEKIHRDKLASINASVNKKNIAAQSKADKEAQELLKQQLDYQKEVINAQKTEIEQENIAHQDRLKKAGFDANTDFSKLQGDQILAYEALQKIRQANLDKLDADAITKHLDSVQKRYAKDIAALKVKNNTELASVKTIEEAKELLKDQLSQSELERIRSLDQAKKALQEKYLQDENKLTENQLAELTSMLQSALESGNFQDLKLSDHVFSEEELEVLSTRLGVAKEKLAEIIAAQKDPGSTDKIAKPEFSFARGKADILGLTPDDWYLFTNNLATGKMGIEEMAAAVQVLSSAWSIYSDMAAASEAKQLKKYQDSSDKKKATLKTQLDSGRLSQEQYNAQVEKIDQALDTKKADIEAKAAKRQKVAALLNIAQSTAQAIMSIWAQVPKFDFGISAGVLTGVVAALGAAQAAVVLKGKEEGGFLDVEREQDGKKFRAKNDPDRRGYIPRTSVIVSENGKEFVASAQAVDNPTIRPFLDILDIAQRNGSISSINMENIMDTYSQQRYAPGRETGGYISSGSSQPVADQGSSKSDILAQALLQSNEVNRQLLERLRHPIKADVSLLGRTGLIAKQDELNRLQQGGNL